MELGTLHVNLQYALLCKNCCHNSKTTKISMENVLTLFFLIQFNTELRRILIALIDSSILLQSVNQEREADTSGNHFKWTLRLCTQMRPHYVLGYRYPNRI